MHVIRARRALQTSGKLATEPGRVFQGSLPGVCPELISPEDLQEQFTTNPHLPLISLKCKPHHYNSSIVIVGDAAHAVLPFYGQGLNAGLEDIRVLFECLDKHGSYNLDASPDARREARAKAFQAYTDQRCADTHAINDLSKQNYLEMRWGVKTPLYKLRKSVEEALDRYVPSLGWQTQYSRVSFSNQRYSDVIRSARWQGRILALGLATTLISTVGVIAYVFWKKPRQYSPLSLLRYSWRRLSSIWVTMFRTIAYA